MTVKRESLGRREFLELGLKATATSAMLPCGSTGGGLILAAGPQAAAPETAALAVPNQPVGVGKGIHPGRVVWARDSSATTWEGPGQGHWWESTYTHQPAVDAMISASMRRLSGESDDRRAWDALFLNFNRTHGRGNAGYKSGEKIIIKPNFVTLIASERSVDPQSYDLIGRRVDYMNTSPQVLLGLLRQLVKTVGVDQPDISVGDPLASFANQYYDLLHREFPGVRYLDRVGGSDTHPRTRVQYSSAPIYWSSRPQEKSQDYVPVSYAEAQYMINVANMKSHTMAGVTLCAKNHFGSLIRTPPDRAYYDLHATLPQRSPGAGHYRDLVDLMGHAHLGGKTLVYLIDGLYPGVHPIENAPRKWSSPPFNGNWASTLLVSQDPVAIDSVGFDFLRTEWTDYPHMSGVDDYLHEAALANRPPSTTFYDPNHPTETTRLASLGVHEHWNNPQNRQYSRNLGKAEGIELVRVEAPSKTMG